MSKSPVRYTWGAHINTRRPLEVTRLPAAQWRRIIEVYPELRQGVKSLADQQRVIIQPATEHDTGELAGLLRLGIKGRRDLNDRIILINKFGHEIHSFVTILSTAEGLVVEVSRLREGQAPLKIARN